MAINFEEFLKGWLAANDLSTAREVNSGLCEDFAIDLSESLPEAEVLYTEDFIDWDSDDYPGGHAWVSYQGKYYDAECLNGVTDWKSLPFFLRKLQRSSDCKLTINGGPA